MTITCTTCGADSGVRLDDEPEVLEGPDLEGWFAAPPRIGEPFRFYCPACVQAGHHEEGQA